MANRFVYADNAATTPVDPEVLEAMLPWLREAGCGNPSTLYRIGREAKAAVQQARAEVAALIGALPEEIFFCGCGSEADNMALRGVLRGPAGRGRKKLVTSTIEHPAILKTARALEKEGFTVVYVPVDAYGRVSVEAIERELDETCALVSIMAANNEIGTIQPIAEIGKLCAEHDVLFHTDAVQAYGHIPLDVNEMHIDLLSLSGHKINAQKGVGALYIRKGLQLQPQLTGGGQERGRRSGTENVPGIVGLGEAARLRREYMEKETRHLRRLQDKLIAGVLALPHTHLTGDPENRLPGSCSFTIAAIEGESLILMLDQAGICASTGSACSSGSLDPSHVLLAIGLEHGVAHGSLRLTLGHQNTEADVDHILAELPPIVEKLRFMSPVWAKMQEGNN